MLVPTVLLLIAATGPKRTSGPAIPLKLVDKLELVRATVEPSWSKGVYSVSFIYKSKKAASELIEDYRRAIPTARPADQGRSYWDQRHAEGIAQAISIHSSRISGDGDNKCETYLGIFESPELVGPPPTRWYGPAIAATAPTPMLDVPFLKGMRTDTVTFTSLEGLTSASGAIFKGSDATIYVAHTRESYADVMRKAQSWAKANGYADQQFASSYYKQATGIFEVEVRDEASGAAVVIYASGKKPTRPVARIKF